MFSNLQLHQSILDDWHMMFVCNNVVCVIWAALHKAHTTKPGSCLYGDFPIVRLKVNVHDREAEVAGSESQSYPGASFLHWFQGHIK
jgi:hypothetical protein